MCVRWTGEWEKAPKDLIAFKAVLRKGKSFTGKRIYQSSVPIGRRDPQQHSGTIGKVLEYREGRYAEGDEPGIYCFETPAMARDHHQEEGIAVIKVKIPKGTHIRRGRAIIEDEKGQPLELLTINAIRVKVVGELSEKDCKSALWPRPRPVSDEWVTSSNSITWSYFVCNSMTTVSNNFFIG